VCRKKKSEDDQGEDDDNDEEEDEQEEEEAEEKEQEVLPENPTQEPSSDYEKVAVRKLSTKLKLIFIFKF